MSFLCFDFTLERVERHGKSKHFHFHLLEYFYVWNQGWKKSEDGGVKIYFHDLFFTRKKQEMRSNDLSSSFLSRFFSWVTKEIIIGYRVHNQFINKSCEKWSNYLGTNLGSSKSKTSKNDIFTIKITFYKVEIKNWLRISEL